MIPVASVATAGKLLNARRCKFSRGRGFNLRIHSRSAIEPSACRPMQIVSSCVGNRSSGGIRNPKKCASSVPPGCGFDLSGRFHPVLNRKSSRCVQASGAGNEFLALTISLSVLVSVGGLSVLSNQQRQLLADIEELRARNKTMQQAFLEDSKQLKNIIDDAESERDKLRRSLVTQTEVLESALQIQSQKDGAVIESQAVDEERMRTMQMAVVGAVEQLGREVSDQSPKLQATLLEWGRNQSKALAALEEVIKAQSKEQAAAIDALYEGLVNQAEYQAQTLQRMDAALQANSRTQEEVKRKCRTIVDMLVEGEAKSQTRQELEVMLLRSLEKREHTLKEIKSAVQDMQGVPPSTPTPETESSFASPPASTATTSAASSAIASATSPATPPPATSASTSSPTAVSQDSTSASIQSSATAQTQTRNGPVKAGDRDPAKSPLDNTSSSSGGGGDGVRTAGAGAGRGAANASSPQGRPPPPQTRASKAQDLTDMFGAVSGPPSKSRGNSSPPSSANPPPKPSPDGPPAKKKEEEEVPPVAASQATKPQGFGTQREASAAGERKGGKKKPKTHGKAQASTRGEAADAAEAATPVEVEVEIEVDVEVEKGDKAGGKGSPVDKQPKASKGDKEKVVVDDKEETQGKSDKKQSGGEELEKKKKKPQDPSPAASAKPLKADGAVEVSDASAQATAAPTSKARKSYINEVPNVATSNPPKQANVDATANQPTPVQAQAVVFSAVVEEATPEFSQGYAMEEAVWPVWKDTKWVKAVVPYSPVGNGDVGIGWLAFSDEGKLVIGSDDMMFSVLDTTLGWCTVEVLEGGTDPALSGHFSPDGTIVVATTFQEMKVWDTTTWDETHSMAGQQCFAFAPNSAMIACGSSEEDGLIRVLETRTWQQIGALEGHEDSVWCLAFSHAGQYLVSASKDNTMKVWETTEWKPVCTTSTHNSIVCGCVFSPDDKLLVTASEDGVVNVWSTSSWGLVQRIEVPCDHGIPCCVFSRCGSALVIASDKELASWDVKTWRKEGVIDTTIMEDSSIWCLKFSKCGSVLAAGADDGELHVWQRSG